MRPVITSAFIVTAFLASAAANAARLPQGASSIQESYQDWQVACVATKDATHCAMTQRQADPKTHKRVLTIALRPSGADRLAGQLLLPFGLALQSGVTLRIDDGPQGSPLPFLTCLPAGCVVALDLPRAMIQAASHAKALAVEARSLTSKEPIAFTVSLKGFASAYRRMVNLGT